MFFFEVYMIHVIRTGPLGVNSLVVELCNDRVFIVDPACCEFCGDETKIYDFLESNKKTPVAVFLTHGHFDHVAGLKSLKKYYPSLPVLIHKNDSAFIGKNSQKIQQPQLESLGFSSFVPCVSSLPEPDFFLKENSTLAECLTEQLKEDEVKNALAEWRILLTPGHTMGSVCFYNKTKKLLISGDTLFYGSYGRTDLGGSEKSMSESLKMLSATIEKDTLVFPGHDYSGFKMGDCF